MAGPPSNLDIYDMDSRLPTEKQIRYRDNLTVHRVDKIFFRMMQGLRKEFGDEESEEHWGGKADWARDENYIFGGRARKMGWRHRLLQLDADAEDSDMNRPRLSNKERCEGCTFAELSVQNKLRQVSI